MIKFVSDIEHYDIVLNLVAKARHTLWIGTADIKDLYVMRNGTILPFLAILSELVSNGVGIRLIHAKEPGQPFRKDFDRYPILAKQLERILCPRVHFKLIIIDSTICYMGSANLTGAGMGMKSQLRRNFEAGIITNEAEILTAAIEEFDRVWRGSECLKCQRKQYCPDPLIWK